MEELDFHYFNTKLKRRGGEVLIAKEGATCIQHFVQIQLLHTICCTVQFVITKSLHHRLSVRPSTKKQRNLYLPKTLNHKTHPWDEYWWLPLWQFSSFTNCFQSSSAFPPTNKFLPRSSQLFICSAQQSVETCKSMREENTNIETAEKRMTAQC